MQTTPIAVTRRELLIGAAAAACLVAGGCATFRRESDLDVALADLDMLLKQMDRDDERTLVAIFEKISEESHTLLETHREFAGDFNSKAADRTVPDASLVRLVDGYEADRMTHRNTLLQIQDELHAAVPADAWPDVLEVLNRKSAVLGPTHGIEG